MAKKTNSRKELLDRWRDIEEQDDDEDSFSDPLKRRRLRQLKELWFTDVFNFLIYLPEENHIWCGERDLMEPLLETFFNYFQEYERSDCPLKLLWTRISEEMRCCAKCIYQHHQGQEMYEREYDTSLISPLLDVLHTLDEERITQHLKEMNAKIAKGQYDPMQDNSEVVGVMFEVLTYPVLLDDQFLATEFQSFIEAIDNSHELTLAGHQQYPGIYALLFLKSRRARSIGFRLAGHMSKLRRSTDLDPLQPLLKKCIGVLETEVLQPNIETSRPRLQLDRTAVWLGIKALLGFLEPPAFEEGILDRYPILLSIVLNHISDDSAEFSYAVNCLRLLFEMLGCKLWLRATLSPSVMRNTLLGQCFHTRNEKIHKEIFDLFFPFLQSLEALQDGEHEKQRRHFIYFLLHQVPVSSNFSNLMRKKACQIALLIIYRGYTMNPPSPPFECAHMWGPSLVNSLKDSSLHSSLRQPAFDLVQTIVVSDASALITFLLNLQLLQSGGSTLSADFDNEEEDEEVLFDHSTEMNDGSCWNDFRRQSRIASRVYKGWMCIPMLWLDVLVGIDPLLLPLSFAKAIFWSLSRLSMVEPENSSDLHLSVKNWLITCASELSHLYEWKVPSGYDDGGNGADSKNSIIVSKVCMPLLRTFKRLTTHYIARVEQGELKKQWTWEPVMSDSLILLLVDSDDNARQVCRHLLEHVSATRGLTSGLQFLCASPCSLSAIFLGLRHALKLVQLKCILSKFQHLHHLFFVLCKLLKEGNSSIKTTAGKSTDAYDSSKFSDQGGFLRQPEFDASLNNVSKYSSVVSSKLWEQFCCFLSELAWISISVCLAEGKEFAKHKASQMTCIRILEILPVVFERFYGNLNGMMGSIANLKWLCDLMHWGNSSLPVVVRYWKQAVVSLLDQLRMSFGQNSVSAVNTIEKLISCENVAVDNVIQQIDRLSISLIDEGSFAFKRTNMAPRSLLSSNLDQNDNCSLGGKSQDCELVVNEEKDNETKKKGDLIILSDDEQEEEISNNQGIYSKRMTFNDESKPDGPDMSEITDLQKADSRSISIEILSSSNHQEATAASVHENEKLDLTLAFGRTKSAGGVSLTFEDSEDINKSKESNAHFLPLQNKSKMNESTEQPIALRSLSKKSGLLTSTDKKQINKSDALIRDLVPDAQDDSWEFSLFKSANQQQSLSSKARASVPKRQVIQLDVPLQNRSGTLRFDAVKRFKAPRLDDWFKPILELDFLATLGLASESENPLAAKLKEVPVSFQTPEEYFDIFLPLVLEEFKAQLLSSFHEMASPEEMSCGSLSIMSIERIDDFHIVRCVHDESDSKGSWILSENDLILLTRQPFQSSSHDVHLMGKVERRDKDEKRKSSVVVVRLCIQNGCSRLNRARKLLAVRSKWCVARLMNITPQLREFQALSSIKEIPLLPIILNPIKQSSGRHEPKKENLGKLSQPLQNALKSSYNDSQLKAISSAIGPFDLKKNFELSLIQGPPGTGKTRTIVAIVSSLLAFPQISDNNRSLTGGSNSTSSLYTNSRSRISQSVAIARAWQDAALARQLNDDAGRRTESFTRRRVLICAQSNAAVDELVSRISTEGLYGNDGSVYKPYLVRVGNPKTIHPNSLPFFIDTLVDRRLAVEMKEARGVENDSSGDSLHVIRCNLEKLADHIRFYEAKRANLRDDPSDSGNLFDDEGVQEDGNKKFSDAELEAKLRLLYEKKKTLYGDLAAAQRREKKASEESKALRYKLRKAILKEAEIVVTTLSGCGGDLYGICSESFSSNKFSSSTENSLFDAVVIDEAAQALEPATLIPLQLLKSKGTRCIMVGDPKQLPATVLSSTASKYMFQCSMFERLQRAGHPVVMLTQQYRMHPEICHFPSLHFYENKLLNGEQMSSKVAAFHANKGLGPYVFFDVIDGRELHGKNSGALSLYNEREADAGVEILKFFKRMYPAEFTSRKIGIITPYRSQLSQLRSRFSSALGSSVAAEMEFNTVDGFQGREVDILLLSTVRAAELSPETSQTTKTSSSSIGFVADVRRMNVALTRAKISLWILGNARTLRSNKNWAALLADAHQRNLVISVSRPYSSIFKPASREIQISNCGKHDRPVDTVANNNADLRNIAKDNQERIRHYSANGPRVKFKISKSEQELPCPRDVYKREKRRDKEECDYLSEKGSAHVVVENKDDKPEKNLAYKAREISVNSEARSCNNQTFRGRLNERKRKISDVAAKDSEPSKKHRIESREQLTDVDGPQGALTDGRKNQNLKSIPTSTGRSNIEAGKEEYCKASNQVELEKDTIAKRKHQREAVDALLSSALISSKKTGSTSRSLPAKSTLAPPHAMRPPKPRKGPKASSSCEILNKTRHSAPK